MLLISIFLPITNLTGKLDTFTKTILKYSYYTNAFLELLVRRVKRSLGIAYTLSF